MHGSDAVSAPFLRSAVANSEQIKTMTAGITSSAIDVHVPAEAQCYHTWHRAGVRNFTARGGRLWRLLVTAALATFCSARHQRAHKRILNWRGEEGERAARLRLDNDGPITEDQLNARKTELPTIH